MMLECPECDGRGSWSELDEDHPGHANQGICATCHGDGVIDNGLDLYDEEPDTDREEEPMTDPTPRDLADLRAMNAPEGRDAFGRPLNTTPRDTPEAVEDALQSRQTINAEDLRRHGAETAVQAVMLHNLRQVFENGGDPTRFEVRVTRQVSDLVLVEIIAGMKP